MCKRAYYIMTKSREGERERDFARVRPTSVEESVEVCGGIGRYVCACTHTRARNRRPKPFLVDVWVEDTHGRRKQRIMVITVIKRRPLRTRPTPPSVENSSFSRSGRGNPTFLLQRFNFLHSFSCNASCNFTRSIFFLVSF